MKKIILFVLASCLFWSCSKKENKVENVEKAFYYWKSNDNYGSPISAQISKANVKKIYFKLFEVDYNETMGNFPYQKNKPSEYDFLA